MFFININRILENICSGILLLESFGIGELLRASFDNLIEYGHMLDMMISLHLVNDYTS